jgi:hypothetical protein
MQNGQKNRKSISDCHNVRHFSFSKIFHKFLFKGKKKTRFKRHHYMCSSMPILLTESLTGGSTTFPLRTAGWGWPGKVQDYTVAMVFDFRKLSESGKKKSEKILSKHAILTRTMRDEF